jgi:hypothetical protein
MYPANIAASSRIYGCLGNVAPYAYVIQDCRNLYNNNKTNINGKLLICLIVLTIYGPEWVLNPYILVYPEDLLAPNSIDVHRKYVKCRSHLTRLSVLHDDTSDLRI